MKNFNTAATEFVELLTGEQLKTIARRGARIYAYSSAPDPEDKQPIGFFLSPGDPLNRSEHESTEYVLSDYSALVHIEIECAQSKDDPTDDPDLQREYIANMINQDLCELLGTALEDSEAE